MRRRDTRRRNPVAEGSRFAGSPPVHSVSADESSLDMTQRASDPRCVALGKGQVRALDRAGRLLRQASGDAATRPARVL